MYHCRLHYLDFELFNFDMFDVIPKKTNALTCVCRERNTWLIYKVKYFYSVLFFFQSISEPDQVNAHSFPCRAHKIGQRETQVVPI